MTDLGEIRLQRDRDEHGPAGGKSRVSTPSAHSTSPLLHEVGVQATRDRDPAPPKLPRYAQAASTCFLSSAAWRRRVTGLESPLCPPKPPVDTILTETAPQLETGSPRAYGILPLELISRQGLKELLPAGASNPSLD